MNIKRLRTRIQELKEITSASDRTGWMVDDVSLFLYTMIKFYKPDLVIQVGHLWGKSACVSLEAISDDFLTPENTLESGDLSGDKKFYEFTSSNSPKHKEAKLISIDAFPYGNWEKGIEYLKENYDNFEFVVSKSSDYFKDNSEKISDEYPSPSKTILGVVDGDHSYEGCYSDLVSMSEISAKVIIVDDTLWIDHINQAAIDFSKKFNYSYQNFDVYNGIGVLIRK